MKKNLYILLWLSFLDIISFSFILPVLPFIIKDFWFWAREISYAVSASAIWMFIWWLIFWRLSDKFWRKKIILASIISNIFWYLLFAMSKNIEIFILSRFICWIWWGWISVIQAFIWDISKENERIKNMWLIWASIWLWFTIWPILGWLINDIWLKNMWYISASILFFSLITALIFITDWSKHFSDKINHGKPQKKLLTYYFSFFIVTASFAWIQTIFWLYLNEIIKFNPKQVAYTFWYLWIIAIIYQWLIMQKYWNLYKEKNILIFWLICLSFSFIIFPNINNLQIVFFVLAFFSIWLASTNSSIYALISKHSDKKDYWKNMWNNTAFWSIADIIWPLIAWILYIIDYRYPFYIFWIFLFINIIWVYIALKKD